MRIVGGRFKGTRFNPPKLKPTRPTTDIAKEGLFNFVGNYYNFDNIRFLDLFGGTGSISYEFASRGCPDITTVEQYPKCIRFIRETSESLGLEQHRILQMDVFQFIANCNEQFDLIFAGPPYPLPNLATLPDLVFEQDMLEGAGWFILEHNPQHDFSDHPKYIHHRNYGTTIFSIFSHQPI